MHIVHVTTVHPQDDVRIFHKMCRTLSALGHTVSLVVQSSHDHVLDGVNIRALPKTKSRLTRALFGGLKAFRIVRKIDADIFHFHDPELLPWAVIFKLTGRNVVFDMHENLPAAILDKSWIPSPLRKPMSRLLHWIETLSFRKVPVIFAELSYRKHYATARYSETVLNLPIHDELIGFPDITPDEFSVVYVGSVSELRGSLKTLEALAIAKKSLVDIHFDCVGGATDEHFELLKKTCKQLELSNVKLHGRKKPMDAWTIANSASLGLATLMPIPNYVESYPTKMFEYMALGIPVLASNFELYATIIEETGAGRVVDPTDASAIAEQLIWFAQNPVEARAMGQLGRTAVSASYNWNHELEKLTRFYETIIKL